MNPLKPIDPVNPASRKEEPLKKECPAPQGPPNTTGAVSLSAKASPPAGTSNPGCPKRPENTAPTRAGRAARIVLPCLCAAVTAFIFFASSRSGAVSGAWSQDATAFLHTGLSGNASRFAGITEPLLRKLGHLGEFALLGITLLACLRAYTPHLLRYSAWPVLAGLLVAVADECLQLTVPGRDGRVTDVLIDFAGLLLGIGLCAAALAIARAAKRARQKQKAASPAGNRETGRTGTSR